MNRPIARRDRVPTFYGRHGRMPPRRQDAMSRLLPRYDVATTGDTLDPVTVFGRSAPLILEIGSGAGEATAAMAAADPGRNYLAAEVHAPGVAHLLLTIEDQQLTNVRVAYGDALELLEQRIAPSSLAAIHAFFPDPWPKARHHKRRLFQPAHVALLRSRLAPGGIVYAATDWADYADAMLTSLGGDPELVNLHQRWAPRLAARPITRYERRAIAAGRRVHDVAFQRRLP